MHLDPEKYEIKFAATRIYVTGNRIESVGFFPKFWETDFDKKFRLQNGIMNPLEEVVH